MRGQFPLMLVVGVTPLRALRLGGPETLVADRPSLHRRRTRLEAWIMGSTMGLEGVVESVSLYQWRWRARHNTCATTGEMMAVLAGKGFRIECNL